MPDHCRTTQADDWISSLDVCPVTLHILTDSHETLPLLELYQQVIDWVDPNLELFRVTERRSVTCNTLHKRTRRDAHCSDIPAIAVTIFLRGSDQEGDRFNSSSHRLEEARQLFQHPPWRFHHSEKLNQSNINTLPNNSQDFFYTSHDLPLWAVRQVHYGREHIRYVMYTSDESWPDQVRFYKLILGRDPDLLRCDFCLFTVHTQESYDVQFALKKIDSQLRRLTLQNVHIHMNVKDAGQLSPLFPNVCRQVSEVRWQTTDHEGNVIVLHSDPVISYGNNNFQQNNSVHTPELAVDVDHRFNSKQHTVNHQEVQQYLTRSENNKNLPLQVPELCFDLINSRHFSYTQQFDGSGLSDFDDFGIDLPSPPLRHISKPEEDEESLTLTNTSEESGIQMQNGSDDLSFCEEDGLRSCLSKNSSLKVRHVKFKVRFKEEIEAFEDFRISSGMESEDQSDVEMETRFPYVPSSADTLTSSEEYPVQSKRCFVQDTDKISACVLSQSQPSRDCNKVHVSFHPVGSCAPYNTVPTNPVFTHEVPARRDQEITGHLPTSNNDIDRHNMVDIVEATCCRHEISRPSNRMYDSTRCPSLDTSTNTFTHTSTNTFTQHVPGMENKVCQGRQYLSSDTQNSLGRNCSSNKNETCYSIRVPSNEISNTCHHYTNKQHIICRPSNDISPAKVNQIRKTSTRRTCNANILRTGEPPTTPQADNKPKVILDECNSLSNKSLVDNCTKSDTCCQLQHVQNGKKRFWFADTNFDLAQNGCTDQKETTLKFTLKFDTCSTSGLSAGQEQIGFYV